ncbi:DUF7847 domain-containing protein [Halobellus limi]|uniref:DUF7847 domain-containing protein n=1 Tax=Halobellus limi TaxID=699433 RepID=A0A1H5YF72_9EURY|nr:hypothetical protein [Halobellus limi]QCC48485.1 hypothetical protein DV707_12885 [Halobellus limi]SEG22257.1 hypothetical protein SAMN04488133_1552 [Halobellus limi]
MAALKSLRPAASALVRNPILAALVGIFGLIQLPQLALQAFQPLLAALVSLVLTGVMILVMPFFQGGLIGMADEALDGTARVETLLAVGKRHYVSLLVAYLVVLAVNFTLGIAAFFAAIFGGAGLFALDAASNVVGLGALAAVGLLFVLAYLLIAFFVQFYAHAIVLSDAGVVAAFKRSVGLVRRNLLSVGGYTAILLVGSVLFGGIGGVVSLLLSPRPTALPVPELSTALLVGAAIVYVVAIAVFGAFYAAYSVAFYRAIDDTTPTA